jgi:D-alanine-D-alanine ligase
MSAKQCVAVLFGGKSGEHDVSLLSATSVIQAIDRAKYIPLPIGISQEGEWMTGEEAIFYLAERVKQPLTDVMHDLPQVRSYRGSSFPNDVFAKVDVVFPVLHGTYGEDGTMQGMLEMFQLPYVGAGVLASATGMDKAISKVLFQHAGLPQAKYLVFTQEKSETIIAQVEEKRGYPCFVKPANLGSSVGISKATDRERLSEAVATAFQYDSKIVVEEFVPAREIEVAVLGNEHPKASPPGEIVSSNDYYDYEAKYISGESKMVIPAHLPTDIIERIQEMAITAYQAINSSGLSRVDFFLHRETGEIFINEINTMPGFTAFSMYPKMWESAGLSYTDLISELIELGMDRYRKRAALLTTR